MIEKTVTWAKAHIKKKSTAFKEGRAAALAGKHIDECPYHGWDNANRQLRLDWCAGHSDVPKKRIKKVNNQVDLEEWLKSR